MPNSLEQIDRKGRRKSQTRYPESRENPRAIQERQEQPEFFVRTTQLRPKGARGTHSECTVKSQKCRKESQHVPRSDPRRTQRCKTYFAWKWNQEHEAKTGRTVDSFGGQIHIRLIPSISTHTYQYLPIPTYVYLLMLPKGGLN